MFEEPGFTNKFLTTLPIFASFAMLYFSIGNPTDVFIFNRKTGMLTYPNGFLRKRTIPFHEATIIQGQLKSGMEYLGIMHKNGASWTSISGGFTDMEALWSFLVWYMDKNRPLPSGSAFDEYRQKDYERRKSEGFPRPLYPSLIAMEDVDGERRYK